MAPEFLGREIKVKVAGVVKVPVSFRLGEQEYIIEEILETWADHSFGSLPPQRQRWWLRKHRNYYRIRTAEGEVFEIYHDRGTSSRWPTTRRVEVNWFARKIASTVARTSWWGGP